MMLRNRRGEALFALALVAPFVAIYGLVFVYPTIKLFLISFTDAPLIATATMSASTTIPGCPVTAILQPRSGIPPISCC